MKTKALFVMAALSLSARAERIIEIPIPNVYSLGTLTTDTGNPSSFRTGVFVFTNPISDFKNFKLVFGFDEAGTESATIMTLVTGLGDFQYEGGFRPGSEDLFPLVSELPSETTLTAIRFSLRLSGADSHYVNFPETLALSAVEFPDRPVPDTGSTSALLGIGAIGLATIKRKMVG